MNKKYSIGFLIGAIAIIVLFIVAYRMSYSHALERKAETEQGNLQLEECYYIKASEGYVTVYLADQKTVYEYTSILVEDLPAELQKRVENGYKVTSLGQVYGFLENYSS